MGCGMSGVGCEWGVGGVGYEWGVVWYEWCVV